MKIDSGDARDNDVLVALLSSAGEIERVDMIGGADDDRESDGAALVTGAGTTS